MSSLTRCLLCRVPLVDGREWDGEDHVCDTGASDGSGELPYLGDFDGETEGEDWAARRGY